MPSILDDFKTIFGGNGKNAVGEAAKYVQYMFDQSYQQLMQSALLPWFHGITTRVPIVWFHPDVDRRCQCGAKAVGMCSVCARNTCISHAYVGANAEIVCSVCVNVAKHHSEPVQNTTPSDHEKTARPNQGKDADRETLRKSYQLIGVDSLCSDEELKEAYKDLLKKWHPDRVTGADRKKRYEDKYKAVRVAYDTIMKSRG